MQTFLSLGGCLKLKLSIPSNMKHPNSMVRNMWFHSLHPPWFLGADFDSSCLWIDVCRKLQKSHGFWPCKLSCSDPCSLKAILGREDNASLAMRMVVSISRGTTTKQILQHWDDSVENSSRIMVFTRNKNEPILSTC